MFLTFGWSSGGERAGSMVLREEKNREGGELNANLMKHSYPVPWCHFEENSPPQPGHPSLGPIIKILKSVGGGAKKGRAKLIRPGPSMKY